MAANRQKTHFQKWRRKVFWECRGARSRDEIFNTRKARTAVKGCHLSLSPSLSLSSSPLLLLTTAVWSPVPASQTPVDWCVWVLRLNAFWKVKNNGLTNQIISVFLSTTVKSKKVFKNFPFNNEGLPVKPCQNLHDLITVYQWITPLWKYRLYCTVCQCVEEQSAACVGRHTTSMVKVRFKKPVCWLV